MRFIYYVFVLLALTGCNVSYKEIDSAILTCSDYKGLYELHIDVNNVWARCNDHTSYLIN